MERLITIFIKLFFLFCLDKIVKGADAKTFKVLSGQQWDAADKNYKYVMDSRKK
jgi:hypothetical protein